VKNKKKRCADWLVSQIGTTTTKKNSSIRRKGLEGVLGGSCGRIGDEKKNRKEKQEEKKNIGGKELRIMKPRV
jgi:hypothetical protein